MKWRCNSCAEIITAGQWPPHVCNSEVLEHAEFNEQGKLLKPEKRTPRESIRNENVSPGVYFSEGVAVRRAPHPEERGQFIEVPAESLIISEGKGRTQIE